MTTQAIPRRLALIAGLAALVVGAIRHVRSAGTVERMAGELAHPAEAAIATIVWHSLTGILLVAGVLLIVSAWRSRGFARGVALMATLVFAIPALLMGLIAGSQLGDPFAFYPIFPLAGVALLSLTAFIRA